MIRDEFTCKMFRLTPDLPGDFLMHQWQSTRKRVCCGFVLYRFAHLAVVLGCIYFIFRDPALTIPERHFNTTYLDVWCFVVLLLSSCFGFLLVTLAYWEKVDGSKELTYNPIVLACYWVCFNIYMDCSICVTILIWGFLYRSTIDGRPLYQNYILHIFNTVIMLVDFFIVSIPVRLAHFYHSYIFAIICMLFHFTFVHCGGFNPFVHSWIHRKLTRLNNEYKSMLLILTCFLLLFSVRVFMFALYAVRTVLYEELVYRRVYSTSEHIIIRE